jgi:hypothetical protein
MFQVQSRNANRAKVICNMTIKTNRNKVSLPRTAHQKKAAKMRAGQFASFKSKPEAMRFYFSMFRTCGARFETAGKSFRVFKGAA